MRPKKLRVVYILSSTYDDEGYVLRFWRGILPSNTLTVLRALTQGVADSGELGDDVDLSVEIYDDTVQRIPVEKIARANRRSDTQLVVGFVGVQSNQFMRATDLALQFRSLGVPVMVGGFHVSGILAMFDEPSPELQHLLDHGVTLIKGEAEAKGALASILRDALNGELRPIYRLEEPPDLDHAPLPLPDSEYMKHFNSKDMATLDTSRGCPFNCSFCTIINVQGRRMRCRSAESILAAVKDNYAHGIQFYFFTDDNFSRSPIRDELLDGLIALREKGLDISFMMQIDTRAHFIDGFAERCARAGCYMAFIGMETVNPANLEATGKVQNDAEDYPDMVRIWHENKVIVHVGYIIGLPHDTRESVRRDVEALMNVVKADEASFFMLTPLPGSQDHKEMTDNRVPMDADLNNFDSLHETFRHPRMAPGEWQAAFRDSWEQFYDKDNIINVLLRTSRERYWLMMWTCIWYRYATLSNSHPMFSGLVRLKDRKQRRSIYPREGVFTYAWRRAKELTCEFKTFARLFFEFQEVWLLTRKPDDPRYAALADLRRKWCEVEHRVRESDIRGRCDEAAQATREMLGAAADRLHQLSEASRTLSARARRRLGRKAAEVDEEICAFERAREAGQLTWHQVVQTERYIRDGLLAGYEELALRYVAKRRRFNAFRSELAERLRTGRLLTLNVSTMARLLVFELVLGLRFGLWFLSKG
ncbi:MAG: radical SAM protein [bacterium]|nr:radical SAM protein [bacterium]